MYTCHFIMNAQFFAVFNLHIGKFTRLDKRNVIDNVLLEVGDCDCKHNVDCSCPFPLCYSSSSDSIFRCASNQHWVSLPSLAP